MTGIWWEELGRTTVSSNTNTVTVSGFAARKYLKVFVNVVGNGSVLSNQIRFNNDASAAYAYRYSQNGSADTTFTSDTKWQTIGGSGLPNIQVIDILNITTVEKFFTSHVIISPPGAASIPDRIEYGGKWVNTSQQITRIDLINTLAGQFASGTVIVVLGHN